MLLSGRMLENVTSVNGYDLVNEVRFTEGDSGYVHFVIIDLNKDQSMKPPGRRYIPAASSTLSVVIQNVDSSKTITRSASNPYATDTSIWRVQILATDVLKGTFSLKLALTEVSVITRGVIKNALSVQPQSSVMV